MEFFVRGPRERGPVAPMHIPLDLLECLACINRRYLMNNSSLLPRCPHFLQLQVLSVSCLPDSAHFVTGSSDNTVRVWDLGTRKCSQVGTPTSIALSFLTAQQGLGKIGDEICLTRLTFSLWIRQVLTDHSDEVWGVACSPDGKRVASVSEDASVVVYSVQ